MRFVAMVAFLLSATGAATAEPPAIEEVFRQFGIFGTWAVECGRPGSPQNPYVSDILEAPGAVVEEHHLGSTYAVNRYQVMSAERISDTQVALEVIFRPGNEGAQRQKLIMWVSNGERRTLFNQPQGGEVRVEDGIVLAAGAKTPTLKKCQ